MREDFLSLLETRKRINFLMICLIALTLLFLKKSFIEDRTAAFEFMSDRPEGSVLALRSTLQYLSVPAVYAWKFTVVGFVVWVGCFMMGYRITFAQCWRVVMAAEFVWFVPEVMKILYFLFVETDPDYYRIQAFYPLSLMNFADHATLSDRYHYPFKSINAFEPVYAAVVAQGLALISRRSFREMIRVMAFSYVPLLVCWLIFWILVYD